MLNLENINKLRSDKIWFFRFKKFDDKYLITNDIWKYSFLTNDEFNLTPEFESNTLEYNVTVPYETEDVFVEGTLIEPDCNITGLGAHALNTGENTVNITV